MDFISIFWGLLTFSLSFVYVLIGGGVTGDLLFIKSGKLKFLKYVYDMV